MSAARTADPQTVQVITATGCPNCPRVVREVQELAARRDGLRVRVLDVDDAEARALRAEHGITAVPATVIGGEIVVQGQLSRERLSRILDARGTAGWDTELLRALLERNRLDWAVDRIAGGNGARAVIPMLLEPELATRMAALLVLQQAHQRAPGCLAATVPDLVALLGSSDARVRGDVADLLGTIGDARALEPLRALCEDADEEVAEAAREAWGSLQARGDGA